MDDNSVFECEGKNGGVLYSDESEFFYRVKDKRSDKQWRLLCAINKCAGKASLINPLTDSRLISVTANHTCCPSGQFLEVVRLRKSILKRCAEETTKLSQIFLEETTRSLFRKIQNLGLRGGYVNYPTVNKTGQMLMALALLPSAHIERGFNVIKEYVELNVRHNEVGEDIDHITEKINLLLSYFENQWMRRVGPPAFSVFNQERRTNNSQESFHHRLMGMIGTAHPNFLGALVSLAKLTISECVALERHDRVRRNRKTKWLLKDRMIREEQDRLVAGPVTHESVHRFLIRMSDRPSLRIRSSATTQEADEEDLVPLDSTDGPLVDNNGTLSVSVVLEQRRQLGEIVLNAPDQLAEEGDLLCVVCRVNKRLYSLRPCNHFALCTRCANVHKSMECSDLEGRPLPVTCPMCRAFIETYMITY